MSCERSPPRHFVEGLRCTTRRSHANLTSARLAVSPLPAEELWQRGVAPVSGSDVASRYGLLAHYTRRKWVPAMQSAGVLGRPGAGCWLAPTAHSACMVPYSLGLNTPRDVCLLVDVSAVPALWGPGTCPTSTDFPAIWRGGGIEFFCPAGNDVPFVVVRQILDISPCGE